MPWKFTDKYFKQEEAIECRSWTNTGGDFWHFLTFITSSRNSPDKTKRHVKLVRCNRWLYDNSCIAKALGGKEYFFFADADREEIMKVKLDRSED